MHRNTQLGSRRRAARGFSLVELLVVIGIISLLIGIALPAFSQAKQAAKVAATSATITTLATGIEQFRADAQLGGAYPPSYFLAKLEPNPHTGSKNAIQIGGASLAVYALAGADLLGSAGIQDRNRYDESGGVMPWADDLNYEPDPPYTGLYRLNGGSPVVPRTAFVDIAKMKFPQRKEDNRFEIPAGKARIDSLAFLDEFGQPILYYRANMGRRQMVCDMLPAAFFNPTNAANTGVYNLADNQNIATASGGLNFGAGSLHFASGLWGGTAGMIPDPLVDAKYQASFAHAVWNPSVTAVPAPQNPETYILLSAGPDGVFGTPDDVGNFPINK